MNIYQQILTKYWGYVNFRPLQEDIIRSVVNGHDTLGLMPTGGGKSITFQVPALAKEGICIVVTPLIALMKDQVENLKKRNIKAIAINSSMTKDEINIALDNCTYGDYKFLYLSPERLETELFKTRIQKMNVNLIAIDESHCISQWGYDFRPSYLKIVQLREFLPEVPFLALTATATQEVVDDIQEKLLFKKNNVLKISFERKNLVYIVRDVEDKLRYLQKIVNKVNGSGIIYVRNRKKTREIAGILRKNGISVDFYHAGLKNEIRSKKQNDWNNEKFRVMVATNAFGMGIDKKNVRFVVNMDIPDSLEEYFQEAGRAGRDGKKAYAVLLYNNSDKHKIEQRIIVNFPELNVIKKIYQALGNYLKIPIGSGKNQVFDFNIADFAATYNWNILIVYNSLKFLQREGYIEITEELNNPPKIHFPVKREELYKFQVANADFDDFIKLILRSYTGVFTNYVRIDEKSLSRKANIDIDLVFKYLNKLNTLKIIKYIPQKKTPLIIFTEERLDIKLLHISKENYKKRKEGFISKLNFVIHYASGNNKCRSQVLLSYFGEKVLYRCGQCDVCKKRNELNLSKYEFDLIKEKVKKILNKEPVALDDLVNKIPYKEDKTLKVVQWLLDNNKIQYLDENKMRWKN